MRKVQELSLGRIGAFRGSNFVVLVQASLSKKDQLFNGALLLI